MVAHACNSTAQEAEAEQKQVEGQSGQFIKILSQNKNSCKCNSGAECA